MSFAAAAVLCGALTPRARAGARRCTGRRCWARRWILFALSAALTKATVEQLDDGVLAVFEHWQLYALVVVGYVSMTLSQASLQAGALAPAVATQMALDPVASLFLGTLAFKETIHDDTGTLLAALAAFAVMIAGSRSWRSRWCGGCGAPGAGRPQASASRASAANFAFVCDRA